MTKKRIFYIIVILLIIGILRYINFADLLKLFYKPEAMISLIFIILMYIIFIIMQTFNQKNIRNLKSRFFAGITAIIILTLVLFMMFYYTSFYTNLAFSIIFVLSIYHLITGNLVKVWIIISISLILFVFISSIETRGSYKGYVVLQSKSFLENILSDLGVYTVYFTPSRIISYFSS